MAQVHLYFIVTVAIAMIFIASHSNACFITNCPPAGKRSLASTLSAGHFRKECTRCGPAFSGRCYGPNICCSPLIGCNIGGAVAARCALEAYNPFPCSNPGLPCGPNGKGVCALNATCCTSDGCVMDKACATSAGGMDISAPETSL